MNKLYENLGKNPISDGVIRIEHGSELQRLRKVVSRSNARATGKWPSWKMGRMMRYESEHEKNAFKILDVCSDIVTYHEQACAIYYVIDGEIHKHIPDILVVFRTHKDIWEVKTTDDAARPEIAHRSQLLKRSLGILGYQYHVVIAEHLSAEPRLSNIETLLKHGRVSVPILEREKIRRLFSEVGQIAWGVFKHINPNTPKPHHICRLILEGMLTFDIHQSLNDRTLISLNTYATGGQPWVSFHL